MQEVARPSYEEWSAELKRVKSEQQRREQRALVEEEELARLVRNHFDLRPAGIIRELDLRRPIYKQTAAYGHFGRTDVDLPWEKTDKAELLKQDASL